MRRFFRITAIVLCISLLTTFAPFTAFAQTEGDFDYTITDNEATVTAYNGTAAVVVIPDTLGGYPVTQIGDNAFVGNETLTAVTFPATLEVIGISSFATCINLTAVNFPSSLVTIKASAFYNCINLANIGITNYTYDIGYQAFHNTAWMTTAEDGILYLGRVAYTYIGQVSPDAVLTLKNGTAAVAPYAFANRSNLKGMYLPIGTRIIGEYAFSNCTSLEFVRVPKTVVTIGSNILFNAENASLLSVTDTTAETYANNNKLHMEFDPTLNYLDGDMNKNGILNSSDIRTLLRIVTYTLTEYDVERYWSSDINYDGVVNTSDVRALMFRSLYS